MLTICASVLRSIPISLLLVCLVALSVDGFAVFPVSSSLRHRTITIQQRNVVQLLALDDNENGPEQSTGVTKEMLLKSETVEPESSDDEKTRSSSNEQKIPQTATPAPPPPLQMSRRDIMNALGTSPERIALSFASSGLIALAANLFGITSGVLSVLPDDLVESTGLDGYYPREWVGDQAVELAKIQQRTTPLDYHMRKSSSSGKLPDAAFGPPGRFNEKGISQSDTNVSVLANRNMKNFTLRGILGPPESAAETLLRVSLAPEGSGRVATLVAACEEERGISSVYQFEYTVDRGEKRKPLRAISVIGARGGDTLITMTVVAPAKDWENPTYEAKLRRVAESFKLTK
eukprot:scaffold10422_cov55-Attheya_sp.AAC.1